VFDLHTAFPTSLGRGQDHLDETGMASSVRRNFLGGAMRVLRRAGATGGRRLTTACVRHGFASSYTTPTATARMRRQLIVDPSSRAALAATDIGVDNAKPGATINGNRRERLPCCTSPK